jgi:hypothetical protein
MEHYAGIDVSLECSSVCVVDGSGKIVRETKVANANTRLLMSTQGVGQIVALTYASAIDTRRGFDRQSGRDRCSG